MVNGMGPFGDRARGGAPASEIPLEFFAPMLLFAVGLELPHDVPVQRSRDSDARHHGTTARQQLPQFINFLKVSKTEQRRTFERLHG
jgi:hypothetical protein